MSNRESTLAELRSIWGNSFDEKIAAALRTYKGLDPSLQRNIDQDSVTDIIGLAAAQSPAYLDAKHPEHELVSARVNSLFEVISNEPNPNEPAL